MVMAILAPSSGKFAGLARKLVSRGYAVFAMDYPDFGLSQGLYGFIPSFDKLVDDVVERYSQVKERSKVRGLPSVMFGHSMGGAVALKVSLPFFILHGEADVVTDPSVSKASYEKASSKGKKLKLYKDSYYSLLEGEPNEMIHRVLDDIIAWLDEHSRSDTADS